MIELTDEIQRAYAEAWYTEIGLEEDQVQQMVAVELRDPMPWRIEALKAVLAIVERDYLARRECGAAGPDGIWCERQPGHDELHGHIRAGELVRW